MKMMNKTNSKSRNIRRIKRTTLASILFLMLVYIAAAMPAPTLNFIYPTPSNNSYQTADFAQINISIVEQNLDTFRFNWNGTNYTFYDDSLVFAMNLNNNSAIGENATHAVDVSSYKNNGTLINGPAWTSFGRFGSALDFDGSNDYVDCGVGSSLNITNGSWELWLKFGAKPSVAERPMNPLAKQEQYWIHASNDDSLQAKITVGGIRYIATTCANFIETGVWYHVAGTYDGETLKLYVNGELKDSNTDPSGNLDTTDAILAIGTWSSLTDYFQGTIDEVRIYNRSLSPTEIKMHCLSEFKRQNSTHWYFYDNVTDLPEGKHTYYGWAKDTSNNVNQTETRILTVDKTPPITTQEYGTPYYTDGENEWITSDTLIYLDAYDEGSGVAYTKYRVWYNGEWTDWLTYTGPFNMTDVNMSGDGKHVIEWYSVDNAGNEESWEEVVVEADVNEFEAYSAMAVDTFGLGTIHMVYTEGGSENLTYETSSDFGVTWTGKTALVSGLDEAAQPDIKTAPNGDIHVVFHGNETGQHQRIYHIWYNFSKNDYSYDNATDSANWENRVSVNDTGRDNVYPQIAIDFVGVVHCVWIGDSDGVIEGGAQDIFYSKFNESGWSPRTALYSNATATHGWPNPQIIVDLYDDLHVVFLDSNEHKMKYLVYNCSSSEWGSYHGGNWSAEVPDIAGNSSASYGTIAGMAIEGDMLHIAWQDVRGGVGQVYENTRNFTTTDAFSTEWQITFGTSLDGDGTSVGETLTESGKFNNLHLFYRDSAGYDIWYMEYNTSWTTPVKVADSGAGYHHWSEMDVDTCDTPLLTYTKVDSSESEFDIHFKKPYHKQIPSVDDTPPTTTKTVGEPKYGLNGEWITTDTKINLTAKDNCHCEKYALLIAGNESNAAMMEAFKKDVKSTEGMLKTNGWNKNNIINLTDPTKADVEKALKDFANKTKYPNCCIFYFKYSGHGTGYTNNPDDGKDWGGRIDWTCEDGDNYNEATFEIGMTKEEWDALNESEGYTYDTDGDGKKDMRFGKEGGKAVLCRYNESSGNYDIKIGEDRDGDHDIDVADGGADLNGDGDKNDKFCIDEGICLKDSNLYDDDLAKLLAGICHCKNIVIEIDACHSGGFKEDVAREMEKAGEKEKKIKKYEFMAAVNKHYQAPTNKTGKLTHTFEEYLNQKLREDGISLQGAFWKAREEYIKHWKEYKSCKNIGKYGPEFEASHNTTKYLKCPGVGSRTIHYRIWYNGEWGPEKVGELNKPVTFKFTEKCKHIIEYWAVDDLGNEEEHHFQTHYVNCKAISVEDKTVQPQDQFTVNITIDPHWQDVYGVQYELYYNTSVVRAEAQVKGPFLGSDTIVVTNEIDQANGIVSYAETMTGNDSCTYDNGTLATIRFTAVGARGALSNLNLSGVLFVDCNKTENIHFIIENGTVLISNNTRPVANGTSKHRINNVAKKYQSTAILCSCSYDPDYPGKGGNITYIRWAFGDGQYGTSEGIIPNCTCKEHNYESWQWENGHYVPFNATLTVTDDGCPALSNSTEFPVTVHIAGDADGDGEVNIVDAVWVGKHWRGECSTTNPCANCTAYLWDDEQADGADLNNDCEINILDAVVIGANWRYTAW